MTRTREVLPSDRSRVVEEYQQAGYSVVDERPGATVLRTRDHGGWKAHVALFLLAPVAGNLIYAAYRRHVSTDRVEVVADDVPPPRS